MAKKLRCYLGLHRWAQYVTEGERYLKCSDCGKYSDRASSVIRYGARR